MLKDYVIYGLKDLIENEYIQTGGGVEILNNAIRLINEDRYLIDDIGCPHCKCREKLVPLGSVDNFKYYECQNCNTKIKVRVFNEIVDYKVK